MSKKQTGKRLLRYALTFKKTILLALFLLLLAVTAELTGPFIAKKMIDDHILGIESPWFEVTEETKKAVDFNGMFLKREKYLEETESIGAEYRIVQVGRDFFFLNEPIEFDGQRTINEDRLTISVGDQVKSYDVTKLSTTEVLAFYQPEVQSIIVLLSFYVGLLVIAAFFQYGKSVLLQRSANRIIQKMRTDVFTQIERVPVSYFDNLPAGKIVSRITNDTEAIRELYVKVLATFVTSIFYLIGIYVALFILNVQLALLTLLVIPLLIGWIILYRKYASKYNHYIRTRLSDINAMINEAIQGMPIIHVFRQKEKISKEFEKLNQEHFSFQNKLLHLNSLTSHNLVGVLRNVTFVVLIWYFGGKSLEATTMISIGMIYALVDYLGRMFQPVTDMVNQLADLEQARVSSERVFELMDEPGEDVIPGTITRYKGHVKFDHVSFAYEEGNDVLKNISFEAKPGETVALVGHTGSGKSSILNLLFRFYDPDKGNILIDGNKSIDIPRQHLRQHMAIVLQDPFLFTGTIASNVGLDNPTISRETIEQSLKDVGADAFINRLPKKYDEPVIEKGSTLSAGERQLISFARALAYDPAILILDEATSNIDTETEAVIQHALQVIKEGRTTFIIAHRLSTIRHADCILVLDRGEIVERGNHEELLERKGKYYQMYQLQHRKNLASSSVSS
ncbi:ABC transporter ATP-binding protein [Bacillus alkalicellulosilyticus]|uniref:ABC transporter ATP-binding protein n=1 Tax=Alkalihalobacterium alkalicellulosilyticum TaxID=1912214 RepID=UPI000996CECB|nr:ABC transporter ATP-binding protein [Bacillus alkalicellulosilyticus]